MTNCMTTNISTASLGWHLDRVGWRLSVPERSCSQPLDCLTAKGRSLIGPIATSFPRQYPSVVVEPDRIYLRDGSIYTSAGITAGMDLALALVEEDHGHQVALEIARILVMFLVRPGGQSQYSHMLSRQAATSQPLRELQVWMIENLRENLSVERLAKRNWMRKV